MAGRQTIPRANPLVSSAGVIANYPISLPKAA
jgi:hypothetical protein